VAAESDVTSAALEPGRERQRVRRGIIGWSSTQRIHFGLVPLL
jgi:hypothetical protein